MLVDGVTGSRNSSDASLISFARLLKKRLDVRDLAREKLLDRQRRPRD